MDYLGWAFAGALVALLVALGYEIRRYRRGERSLALAERWAALELVGAGFALRQGTSRWPLGSAGRDLAWALSGVALLASLVLLVDSWRRS